MNWTKKGLIYSSGTHAQIPIPYPVQNGLRVYFSARDSEGRTNPTFVELDPSDFKKVVKINNKPLLLPGEPGAFDDSGVMASCLVPVDNKLYLYYTGWNKPVNVSYRLAIGLAISSDGGLTFSKYSKGPVLDRSIADPFWPAAPHVLLDQKKFRMWYISCTGWKSIHGKLEPVYNIRHAESLDGISWTPSRDVCIDYVFDGEALGRPWVLHENGRYRMFYSRRGSNDYRSKGNTSYRIGYAESTDGYKWARKDNLVNLGPSDSGWDSDMVAYASVLKNNGRYRILYNGNGFGRSGFGFAETTDW